MANEHTPFEPDRGEGFVGDETIDIVRLERGAVRKNEPHSGEDFEPASVRGEPVSATILRERR
jgi:hypothetical protein